MRNTTYWRSKITGVLHNHWRNSATNLTPATFCDIELGLYLLSQLAPQTSANALWVLLTGYPFPVGVAEKWNPQQHKMLGNARYILDQFRSKYSWERALKRYRQIDERLRGFDVDEGLVTFSQRPVSVCPQRHNIYSDTLQKPLPHRKEKVKWASAGSYECSDGHYLTTVNIPKDLIFPPPSSHKLTGKTQTELLKINWEELIETARWMDTLSSDLWEERLSRIRLEIFAENSGKLTAVDSLTLNGLMHLIGMVSSGKSTLMDILAVWASRCQPKLHVTIVVGDVIAALNRAKLFTELGISVAPILGRSNRERHTNRLHNACNAEHPFSALTPQHQGFRWLSTACALSELRRDVAKPFPMGKQPCDSLSSSRSEAETEESEQSKTYACPLYSACAFHQAQRDLVEADIWIATPASLIFTRIASQINAERLRFFELVYRRSDLVIVDEADQVQVQLDHFFSPSQKLFGRGGDGWLSSVQQPVVQQLNLEGRRQLADEEINNWCKAHNTVQTVIDRIYAVILTSSAALGKWAEKGEYFTGWLILNEVAFTLSGAPKNTDDEHSAYRRLRQVFDEYIDDPLGDIGESQLSEFVRQLISGNNEKSLQQKLEIWINQNKEPTLNLSETELKNLTIKLKFGLLAAVLQNRLNQMLRDWKQVEAPLKLEGQSSILFHTPPKDYDPIIPASPMGNVLAFQYVRAGDSETGDLRFFKCSGVGRWLLLHLHELFNSDGIFGPHVLLLSGTSWAGLAPGYHVQVPVAGVLHSPDSELQAISESEFEFKPFYDQEHRPITVSGNSGQRRVVALQEILNQLAKTNSLGGPSFLEQQRDDLPENRQSILLLVGSYVEAKQAQEYLEKVRPDWRNKIIQLIPDDGEIDSQLKQTQTTLQRGLVSKFASTDGWILIAPLMAIERGHNILNEDGKAAIGAAFFLVRPHPRPDDISYAIHSINRWAIDHYADKIWLTNHCHNKQLTLENVGDVFRDKAYQRWHSLLRMPMVYSTLPDKEREAVTWNQLVSIWQVIGRLIRGGVRARVFFCDAAFARRTAFQDEEPEVACTSLLVSIKQVLRPYFTPNSNSKITEQERSLVQALYGPFYTAIENMRGITDDV